MIFAQKNILVTGGTGSLGSRLIERILSGRWGDPKKVVVFSRDEAKQHKMRLRWKRLARATDDVIYRDAGEVLDFQIGDIRDFSTVQRVLDGIDIVINAAALKQVPTCEYFPMEAVRTNIVGAYNIVEAIRGSKLPVETVVGVSTDKAAKAVNVMGMTKSLQERILILGNQSCRDTRFICVRYGNVLASRGSVIPLFHEQIRRGGPVTITTEEMTRFLLSLDDAIALIVDAIRNAKRGETYIPKIPAARIGDVAEVLIDGKPIDRIITGVRPGEKTHEILITEEEAMRTICRGAHFVIRPILPELNKELPDEPVLSKEYCSKDHLLDKVALRRFLHEKGMLLSIFPQKEEILA